MTTGVRCPKCNLLQLPGPTCKSCGAHLGGPARRPPAPPRPTTQTAPRPTPPAMKPPAGPRPPSDSRPAEPDGGGARQLFFHGRGGSLFGIHIVNLLLTVVTLGVYYFWAKVRVRAYILSETEFAGDRFAYHGTGKEMLFGFLKALLLMGVPFFLVRLGLVWIARDAVAQIVAVVLSYVIVFVFFAFATVGARRYRLSRTSWRGIRFSFRGSVTECLKLFFTGFLLNGITLGLYYPFFDMRLRRFLVSHSYCGNQEFSFDGRGKDLFGWFLLAIVLTLPTLGLYWFWFAARKERYIWDHTSFGTARFHCTVTGGRLFLLTLTNALLLIFTLGLAWPWMVVRTTRFAFTYLTIEGPIDLEAIQQDAQTASATGEGLAGMLDAGFDFGV